MLKNNRQNALLAITVATLFFLVITAVSGGWPGSGRPTETAGLLEQAVSSYYERMPEHLYKITEPELKQLIDSQAEDIYLLDIRDPKDYALGHISGAHNIPFKQIGENLSQLPKDKTIIVYCYTGQTGGQTAALLNVAGFKARSLNGGMDNGWLKAGYQVVTPLPIKPLKNTLFIKAGCFYYSVLNSLKGIYFQPWQGVKSPRSNAIP